MTFQDAIKAVRENLDQTGTTLLPENYDGLIVKKLESSNTLDDGRTTNQTLTRALPTPRRHSPPHLPT